MSTDVEKKVHPEDTMQVSHPKMTLIHANENFNCRGAFSPSDVVDLVRSIEASQLIQPVCLRRYSDEDRKIHGKQYEFGLVAGFRRHMAFRVLRRETIPAIVIEKMSDVQARIYNLKENLDRKNLNVLQEAKAIEQFRYLGMNREAIAEQVGQSTGWVQIRFMLLDMSPEIQEVAASGIINQTHIRELYAIKDPMKRNEAVKAIKNAKIRGESTTLITKTIAKKGNTKRLRTRTEIFIMQDEIRKLTGPNILTRLLGWACGEVSDLELQVEMKDHLSTAYGIEYNIPEQYLSE